MFRGAFTLIETMIVVMIVAAISAIYLPSLVARMTEGKLGFAGRSIESGAALAGAEAMERSRVLAYVAERWGDEWVLFAEEIEAGEAGALLSRGVSGLAMSSDDGRHRRQELTSFPDVLLTDRLPPAKGDAIGAAPIGGIVEELPATMLSEDSFAEPGGVRERYVLAVFFADGSCRAGPPMYLVAHDGTREVIRLHPLTGHIDVRRLSSVREEIDQLKEAEEAEELVEVPALPASRERRQQKTEGGAGP